uniref:Uncharacterized protein n=2 Tax=Myzomyia TaxID=59140 RepID=A0A182MTM0_9DIPT
MEGAEATLDELSTEYGVDSLIGKLELLVDDGQLWLLHLCSKLFDRIKMRHAKFIARTVLVQNNNVEEACRVLNRILGKEEIYDQFRRTRYYEKPFQTRRRINFERCKSIYNEDMNRKIQFVLRKNRVEPFPGCN